MATDLTPRSKAQSIPIRPLKGIHRELASTAVPTGGLLDCANLIANRSGLRRRAALYDIANGQSVEYPPLQGFLPFFKPDGTQELLAIDQKFLYKVDVGVGLSGVYWTYGTGTVSVSGTTVTGSGTSWSWSNFIRAGDVIVLDADGSGDGPESVEILTVVSTTQIELASAPTGTYGAGTDYVIRRAFAAADPYAVDWAIGVGMGSGDAGTSSKAVFADSVHPTLAYDGASFGLFDAGLDFVPTCVAHHLDRLWWGRYIDAGTDWRQAIIWSEITDKTSVPGNFVSLPYVPGYVKRLVPLGNLLMAYFSDSVWAGTRTQGIAGSLLPVSFQRIDFSGVGLLGPRSVCSALGGHFAVLQDNIYFVGAEGLELIGDPVVRATVQRCQRPQRVTAAFDAVTETVAFGFPEDGSTAQKLWRFHIRSKEWSYDEIESDTVGDGVLLPSTLTYGNWAGAPYATGTVAASGTTTLTGSGTSWLANVEAGARIHIDTLDDGRYVTVYTVSSVTSDTELELTEAASTFSGKAYYAVNPDDQVESLPYPTYGAIGIQATERRQLFLGRGGRLLAFTELADDYDGSTIGMRIETPDYDGGAPDDDKFWSRLSMKLAEAPSADLTFTVQFSTDRGRTWQPAGQIVITSSENEDYVNFRATGSHIRFRISSTSSSLPYTIEELCFRVLGRDAEWRPGD